VTPSPGRTPDRPGSEDRSADEADDLQPASTLPLPLRLLALLGALSFVMIGLSSLVPLLRPPPPPPLPDERQGPVA
jgi:hypothetical protein